VVSELGLDKELDPNDYEGRENVIKSLGKRVEIAATGTVFLEDRCSGSAPVDNKKVVDRLADWFVEKKLWKRGARRAKSSRWSMPKPPR